MPGGKSDNRPVGLRIRSKSIGVLAREDDEMTCEELEVPVVSKVGPPVTVFVNRDYLPEGPRLRDEPDRDHR